MLGIFFITFSVIIIIIITIFYFFLQSPKHTPVSNSHVLITGGSSGIGKALALKALQNGARVTLVARNEDKLSSAKKEIATEIPNGDEKVQTVSVDLTSDYSIIQKKFDDCQATFGPVKILFNCAGGAGPGRFDEVPVSDFQKMINMNYLSAVHATKAVLPNMKNNNEGRIVFISSQAGQLGLFGFTAYSASKFALRGLAESLQMEMKPFNVFITLAFPPDTDTPGLAEEEKLKPEETKLISETAGLFPAEYVASKILKDAVCGNFFCSIGIDGMMLSNLTCGFSPVSNLFDAILQVLTMGIFRIVSIFYLYNFDKIIYSCKTKRDARQENYKNK